MWQPQSRLPESRNNEQECIKNRTFAQLCALNYTIFLLSMSIVAGNWLILRVLLDFPPDSCYIMSAA
jgi:hypothetical protein